MKGHPMMSVNLENFRSWYVQLLEQLYPQREAGFALLMIVFPLLERYLRLKVGLTPDDELRSPFFEELSKRFPTLQTEREAREFWQVFRNGLLHQVVFANQTRGTRKNPSRPLPAGVLSHDFLGVISVTSGGSFFLNPPDFAKEVIKQIEADFATYEGGALPLPTEWAVPPEMVAHITSPAKPLATLSPVNLPTGYILGTSGKPPTS